MKKVLLTLLLSLLIPFAAVAQEAYAVYNNGTLTFYYDNLRSSRTGTTYDLNKPGIKVPDWDVVRLEIQKAVIDPLFINARPTTTYHWFAVGYNEKSILKEIEGLEYLNTSQVTDMGAMFYGCSELNSIDVSHFDTSKCTYFNSMFYNCKNVTNIDVSSFNTNKAIYMSFMFYGCSSLTNLDVSHFDTKNIRDMTGMFEGCNSLKSVDVSNFDTNNCSKMTQMFYGCANLTELDVSNFNTSKVESMKYMFRNCYNLKKLDVSNFNTENVTDMSSMFSGCNSLSYIDVNNFDTSKVTDMGSMFQGCNSVSVLDVSHFKTNNVTGMNSMFERCNSLSVLDIANFSTNKVDNMSWMFAQCTNLKTIYVGESWSTSNVKHFTGMFGNCTSLVGGAGTKYDANHIDISYAHIDGGPSNPGYLTDKNATPQTLEAYAVYTDDGTLTFYYDNQRSSRSGKTYDLNTDTNEPGWYIDHRTDITKVVFDSSFSDARPTSTYKWFAIKGYPENSILSEIVGMQYLNTSAVTNMRLMFFDCSNLTSLDVSHFDTSNVTSMNSMFYFCSGLTSLDLSNFNTSKVVDMNYMFSCCDGLKSLDIRKFDTGKVYGMISMFYHCINLTSLDISHFNTSNVEYMGGMFSDCNQLTNLDVSHFDTRKVTDMKGMFHNCTNLTTIYVGEGWNTDKVSQSANMFLNCSDLVGGMGTKYDANHVDKAYAHVDGGPSNPGYLTDKNSMQPQEAYAVYTEDGTLTFYYDNQKGSRSGTIYGMNTGSSDPGWHTDHRQEIKKAVFDSSFAKASPTSTYRWFAIQNYPETSILTEIVGIEHLNTSAVVNMAYMFWRCSGLTSLDVTHFDTSKVTNMNRMFSYCSGLTGLDVTHFDTSKVRQMNSMFMGCSGLTSLDLSHFDTSNVVDMHYMFSYCSGLTSLDVTHFNTNKVIGMSTMFNDCSGLTSLDVSNFNTSKVTNMGGMFYGCSSLTSLDVTHFDTSKASDMGGMFSDCSGLTSLDVSHFDTSNVTSMGGMFSDCSGLTSLDVSNFNTSNVTNMGGMFSGCSGLTSLDLSHFDTSNVTTMGYSWGESLFQDCTNLTTIYVGDGWNTDNVKDSGNMFLNCINLVGGMGTKYDANHVGIEYAHIDGGPSNPGYLTGKNVQAPVSDSDDLQDFINSLGNNKGTEDDPVDVPVDPNGLTIDNDVDIVDDLQLAINGNDTENKVHVCFWSGFFNIGQNSGLSFKNVVFASKDVAAAMQQRAAGNGSGIKNNGTLKFANCTFLPGEYTVENSSNTYIGEGVTGCRLVNKTGGRINITSPLTDDLTIAVPTEADVEPDVAIVTGVSNTDHILMSLPSGYAYKYDATAGGIVVYSTTGITTVGKQSMVMDSYDLTGRKVDSNRKGMTIHRMSNGTVKKVITKL